MRYRFQNTIIVDTPAGNKKFSAGDEIDGSAILAGCLASCLGTKALIEIPDAAPGGSDDPPPVAKPAKPKKKRPGLTPDHRLLTPDH